MADEIIPGSNRRPWGCRYFDEDHQKAAEHVRAQAPEVFSWIKDHPDGLPDDIEMHQLLWRTTMEVLPKATLVDHANVTLTLRLAANPLSKADLQLLEQLAERTRTEKNKRNN